MNTKSSVDPTWYKAVVTFKDKRQCDENALPLAMKLRKYWPFVYFARYNDTVSSQAHFYFQLLADSPRPPATAIRLLKLKETKVVLIKDPVSGSEAHAAGFDAVVRVKEALEALVYLKSDPAKRMDQFADVIHWMYNMMGIDYAHEGICNLRSVYNVLRVFISCIEESEKQMIAQTAARSARNFKKNIKAGKRCKRCGCQPGFCICEK